MTTRRGLLLGSAAILAAPAIVRATSLMPVRPWAQPWMHVCINVAPSFDPDPPQPFHWESWATLHKIVMPQRMLSVEG